MKLRYYCISVIILCLIISCGNSPSKKITGEWEIIGIETKLWFLEDGTFLSEYLFPDGKWEVVNKVPIIVKIFSMSNVNPIDMRLSFIDDDILTVEMIGGMSDKFKMVRVSEKDYKISEIVQSSNDKNRLESPYQAHIDAVEASMTSAVILWAADYLAKNEEWLCPPANEVTIANMIEGGHILNWSDNGIGKWKYSPTGATLSYQRIDGGKDYKIIKSNT